MHKRAEEANNDQYMAYVDNSRMSKVQDSNITQDTDNDY